MIKVGANINRLAREKGLTPEQLAGECAMDLEQLNQILNDEISPNLSAIVEISRALKVTVEMLIDGNETIPISVTHKEDRPKLYRPNLKIDKTINYHSMAHDSALRAMEPYMVTFKKGNTSHSAISSHEGEEFVYVVRGEIEISLGEQTLHLKKGDSLYYDSLVPHFYKSISETSKILAVLYNPL